MPLPAAVATRLLQAGLSSAAITAIAAEYDAANPPRQLQLRRLMASRTDEVLRRTFAASPAGTPAADVITRDELPTAAQIAADPALMAAFGRAAPVLSNFSYDSATGNLLSYQEDGITTTLTYNADGTVATSKRGAEPTQTYTYTGGNLTGVA